MLQENLSQIRASTWELIRRVLIGWAAEQGLEKGRKVRVDATTVETDIHHPIDSELLYDGVYVLSRLLKASPVQLRFTDHRRRAKKRLLEIRNRRQKRRDEVYRDLLKVTDWVCGYVRLALQNEALLMHPSSESLVDKLRHYLGLVERVIDQTQRRVLRGESVPAEQKLNSIFEEHTDIIRKGNRKTIFGYKIYLTCGQTSLMLDCVVQRGNPADSNWTRPVLKRQQDLYGRYPRQVSFDGGFASANNLKRVFGLRCCSWKGWAHFQQYVQLSVVSYNLIILARLLLR